MGANEMAASMRWVCMRLDCMWGYSWENTRVGMVQDCSTAGSLDYIVDCTGHRSGYSPAGTSAPN